MKITRRNFIKRGSAFTGVMSVPAWMLSQASPTQEIDQPIPTSIHDLKGIAWIGWPADEEEWVCDIEFFPQGFDFGYGSNLLDDPVFGFLTSEEKQQYVTPDWYNTPNTFAFWYFYLLEKKYSISETAHELELWFRRRDNTNPPSDETCSYGVRVPTNYINNLQKIMDDLGTGIRLFRSAVGFTTPDIAGEIGWRYVYTITPKGNIGDDDIGKRGEME